MLLTCVSLTFFQSVFDFAMNYFGDIVVKFSVSMNIDQRLVQRIFMR